MSKTNTEKKNQSNKNYTKWLCIGLIAAVVVIGIVWAVNRSDNENKSSSKVPDELANILPDECKDVQEAEFTLDKNLKVVAVGSYSGDYMEDGSDEAVSDVMMIVVANEGEDTLQYAEITLTGDTGKGDADGAVFKLSTLKPGDRVMVLEANRKAYSSNDSYTEASIANVVFFTEPLSLYEDKLEIQPLEGGFNITNISDEDITGDIVVYFKSKAEDMYQGGITYRGRIEGGLNAGEIRQVMSEHFYGSETKVMFITIAEE